MVLHVFLDAGPPFEQHGEALSHMQNILEATWVSQRDKIVWVRHMFAGHIQVSLYGASYSHLSIRGC